MKAIPASGLALAVMLLCGGCKTDDYARQIVRHNRDMLMLTLAGSDEDLVRHKRIDLHQRFTTGDGTEIDAWVIKARPSASATTRGTAVLLHGRTQSKGHYLRAGELTAKKGFDVVLPDLRAHGRSTGKYITFGAREKQDVKSIMDALISAGTVRPPVYAFGCNLGGATAIQYAAIEPRCKGVVAVAPYKDAASMGREMIGPAKLTMSAEDYEKVLARAGEMADFNPHQASSEVAAMSLTCPLLLVHGLLDVSVPVAHSQAIHQAAAGPKKLIIVTPGPEQFALAVVMDQWIADRLEELATKGLPAAPPAPRPPASP